MAQNTQNNNAFLTTALIGGALGIAAAYFCSNSSYFGAKDEDMCDCCGCEKSECSCSCISTSLSNPLYLGAACALLGAGAALLMAPKSGKDLRENISDVISKTQCYASDLTDKGEDMIHDAVNTGNDLYVKAKSVLQSLAGGAKETTKQTAKKANKEVVNPVFDKIEEAINVVQTGVKLWNALSTRR